MIQRYPLQWPEGWKRTPQYRRHHSSFGKGELKVSGDTSYTRKVRLNIGDAVKRVHYELERLGVKHVQEDVVISTNLRVNLSGIPRGDQGEPSDPGVAVYWELKGKRQCIAIDRYNRVADNLAAIAATLEAMRAIERHGGAEILDRAFTGFAQLPANTAKSWREVLGITLEHPTPQHIEERFRALAFERHPDRGGSETAMQELNLAREQARRELQAESR